MAFDYEKATAAMETFSQKDIDDLKSWVSTLDPIKYIPKDMTDKQLVLFYNACEGNMVKTKICLEKYFSYKKNAPEFFDNRDVTLEDVLPSLEAL